MSLTLIPKHVKIVEVGPRDGLQNEAGAMLSASVKANLINQLAATGLRHIEAAAFVHPKWVPQMANSSEVLAQVKRLSHVSYSALTPNLKGLERALKAGVNEVAVFAAATESFSERNTNCSMAEGLARFEPLVKMALEAGIKVRGYVSVVIDCPYEGAVKPQVVAQVAHQLQQMGCYEISLGDTIGTATPGRMLQMLDAVQNSVPVSQLAGHCHDTYGQALANVMVLLQAGVSTFDSSVAGLGGCPYAKGASGNLATEDLVYLLHGLNIKTNVDLDRLVKVGHDISQLLGRPNGAKAGLALYQQGY
ncbi:hydroxymethylglutaryl-CoA lyase [Oceanospirillaceae bacterium]|jgi:hydroxymethylglutaryl-CoA lyase|nr:hydroxymethylglutaryl-CoA lyase [Oceanospirillaceae bacterium]MBT4996989.1 hydroxymethylglutaryl-CoA lyase [Oceanospirillaceae bacterium]MBT5629403.1 hydroxymethylglutaryl-CoA lyase [Oceanospirillaceae bacterium]MBT7673675.1 hydroxymethylglutaryl-CoA lyase [Oceanospirillaceae bacterium]MDC1350999.1 hydroxymethylglutaryl-CoA lyase [Oceanospirillaceae bacterium]